MLPEFIETNRCDLIARTRAKVSTRLAPPATYGELRYGVPLLLDQLVESLRLAEETPDTLRLRSAAFSRMGFSVVQVIHGYRVVFEAVNELADELELSIPGAESCALDRCVDDAIAQTVTEYRWNSAPTLWSLCALIDGRR